MAQPELVESFEVDTRRLFSTPVSRILRKKKKRSRLRTVKMQLPAMFRHGAVSHNQEIVSVRPRGGQIFRAIIDGNGTGDRIVNFGGELVSLSEAAKRACNCTNMKRSSVDGYTFWKCAKTGKMLTHIRQDLVEKLMRRPDSLILPQ